MRHILRRLALLPLTVLLLLPAAGCKDPPAGIDGDAVLDSLLEQVAFDTALSEAEGFGQMYFSGLPEGTAVRLYMGNGRYADEAALLTLPKASDGEQAAKAVQDHIAELREQFLNYLPEEVDKIDHAVVRQEDRSLFLCVTGDYESAALILDHAGDPSYRLPERTPPPGPANGDSAPELGAVPSEAQPSPAPAAEYPSLRSRSGTYLDYGNAVIRVDNAAFDLYTYSDAQAEAYAQQINRAAEALAGEVTVYDLPIPTAVGVVLPDDIAEQLPGYADQGEAVRNILAKMSDRVVPVDCFDNLMQHRDEYLYFRTDFHWNGRGAYCAYESFCRAAGLRAVPLEEREEKQFGGFLGALYWNYSGEDPLLAEEPDTVIAYCPKSPHASMTFTDRSGHTQDWPIIQDVSGWKASTKYSTFAGADNPYAVFTNPDAAGGPVCVIVKESFGNALLPFLVDHYSTIYEIDYRYWEGDLIEFVRSQGADDLIFANNLSMITSNFLIGKLAGIME